MFGFCHDVAGELQRVVEGTVPTHRLWGFAELAELGWSTELAPRLPGHWRPLGAKGWRLWQSLWFFREAKSTAAIIAVHEITALLYLLGRALGCKGPPVVVLDLAVLHPKNLSGYRFWIWRWLLPKADRIVSLVGANCAELHRRFGVDLRRTRHVPMAVDIRFSEKASEEGEQDFVLSVGTNDGKDFETLMEALPLGVRLIVVTDAYNAQKIKSHPCYGAAVEVREAVSAVVLRKLYLTAAVVVIPLGDTTHGSGHTVLLETMSMGKIVVVSDARCMRDYIHCDAAVLSVPVGDSVALRLAIQETLGYPERFSAMRERAVAQVRCKFDVRQFARRLDRIIADLVPARSCAAVVVAGSDCTRTGEGGENYASVS
jgi:glycosyltransferase involved in cell wall biosynthesis